MDIEIIHEWSRPDISSRYRERLIRDKWGHYQLQYFCHGPDKWINREMWAYHKGLNDQLAFLAEKNKKESKHLKDILQALTRKAQRGISLIAFMNSTAIPVAQRKQMDKLNEVLKRMVKK